MADQTSTPVPAGDRVVVAETHLGRLQLIARAPDAAFIIDEPVSAGGLGTGPNPYDLLAAALGACTALTLRLYADRKGWPLRHVEVAVRHHRASLKARDLFERTIELQGPLTEEQQARLMEIAERCPVHQTLDRGADVKTSLLSSVDPAPSTSAPAEHRRDMEQACEGEGRQASAGD
jgi:putative redox protein